MPTLRVLSGASFCTGVIAILKRVSRNGSVSPRTTSSPEDYVHERIRQGGNGTKGKTKKLRVLSIPNDKNGNAIIKSINCNFFSNP